MHYRPYGKLGYDVSLLGMGCMRLPRIYDGTDKAVVDREKAYELIRYAADHGVNYFDTAFAYHHRTSEEVLGEALEGGYRKRVKIATKQPLFAMETQAHIRKNLENTLKKLRTDYIDIYLVHNITNATWETIKTRKIYDEYVKFRDEGLIRAIGFSFHGTYPVFKDVLNHYPWDMCQVQQNLLDTDREATEQSIIDAGEKGTAVVIMEPLRGGGLVTAPPVVQAQYESFSKNRPAVEWAFRHLINYPQVSCILSGMTTLEQLKENIALFSKPDAVPGCLSAIEKKILSDVKQLYKSLASIPCTGCEYCLPCPNNVNIPGVFARYNEGVMFDNFSQPKRSYMIVGRGKQDVSQCTGCRICEEKCPQHIEISEQLKVAHHALSGWIE